MAITNNDARNYVMRKEEFKTGNQTIFAKNKQYQNSHTYTVYSYGRHFPMYVYDYVTGEWYGNADKYSRTTSSHQSKTRPPNVADWFDTEKLMRISDNGLCETVALRMAA